MVKTVGAPFAPGVTVAGKNITVEPGGSPVADMVTRLLNAPPSGGTLTLIITEPPSATRKVVCAAVTAKVVFTVKGTAAEVEGLKLVLPEYMAVSESAPAGSVELARVATPEALGAAVPRVVAPLKKVTRPRVLPPEGAGEMEAVSVTVCPNVAGLGEAVKVVAVFAGLTVKLSAGELEGLKAVFPE